MIGVAYANWLRQSLQGWTESWSAEEK